ncbi:hypothetical protein E2C01_093928 [Portunus trituberculatus]|uniref:Uncharacterized protein n=1 Tax=Portunus trituberculatus TaxID=210409 RepID=A0A5B7K1R4_PORTR|nr:hypothetical protein [Portunus trituberculatus]
MVLITTAIKLNKIEGFVLSVRLGRLAHQMPSDPLCLLRRRDGVYFPHVLLRGVARRGVLMNGSRTKTHGSSSWPCLVTSSCLPACSPAVRLS